MEGGGEDGREGILSSLFSEYDFMMCHREDSFG